MISLFKLLCLSFAWITLLAVAGALVCSWIALSPKSSPARAEVYTDRIYQCVHVAQWTLLASGVSGIVWRVFECFAYWWVL